MSKKILSFLIVSVPMFAVSAQNVDVSKVPTIQTTGTAEIQAAQFR